MQNTLYFGAGVVCCCVLCFLSQGFLVAAAFGAPPSTDRLRALATRGVGKGYEAVIADMQREYTESGLAAFRNASGVLVYRIGSASVVKLPSNASILAALGVDKENIVRQVVWDPQSPATVPTDGVLEITYL